MDHQQYLLYYTLIFIWLLPFTFGDNKVHDNLLDTCLDGKYHKIKPSLEVDLHSQCKYWKFRSCCTHTTSKRLHEPMHHNFNLDHCSHEKRLSEQCKKHFIQDLCFYECSPNVGPWLVKVNMTIRKERFYNVPLCADDCFAWYEACKDDFTCNGNWLRGWEWSSEGNSCKQNATCQTFQEIFHNAVHFCEKIWDHSWKVVLDSKPCMKIFFNDSSYINPNDDVAKYYYENPSTSSPSTSIPSTSSPSALSLSSNLHSKMNFSWIFLFVFFFTFYF